MSIVLGFGLDEEGLESGYFLVLQFGLLLDHRDGLLHHSHSLLTPSHLLILHLEFSLQVPFSVLHNSQLVLQPVIRLDSLIQLFQFLFMKQRLSEQFLYFR